ncbi:MAG: zinc ribbon domain-containing protein [Clostridiales bacterium]|nr:zinc ribbon domain-containing protein [Clostridiales bacterium]
MAKDILSGLSGLMKGFSGLMPQDDPQVKLLSLQAELGELEGQALDVYAEIGRQVYEADPDACPQADRLRLIRTNLDDVRARLDRLKQEQAAEQRQRQAAEAALLCPNCDHQNPQGTTFCQACGSRLAAERAPVCSGCGAPLSPEARFCGACGAKQGG